MNKYLLIFSLIVNYTITYAQVDTILSINSYVKVDSNKTKPKLNIIADSTDYVSYYTIKADTTNSKLEPKAAIQHPLKLSKTQTFVTFNGLKVILIQNEKFPIVSYTIFFDYYNRVLGEKKGIDNIFYDLWGKSSKYYSAKDIETHKQTTSTKIEVGEKFIYLEGLDRYRLKNLKIISDLALGMSVTDSKFKEEKNRLKSEQYFNSNNNQYISESVGKFLMFGDKHPNGEKTNLNSIDSLSKADLTSFYKTYYNINNSYLVVYGNISLSELKTSVSKYFNKYKKHIIVNGFYPQPYNLRGTEIDFIENYSEDSLSVWMGNVDGLNGLDPKWFLDRAGEELLFRKDDGLIAKEVIRSENISNFSYNYRDMSKFFSIKYKVSEKYVSTSILNSVNVLKQVIEQPVENKLENTDLISTSLKYNLREIYTENLTNPKLVSFFYLKYYLSGINKFLIPNLMGILDTSKQSSITNHLKLRIKPNNLRIVVSGPPQIAVPQLEKLGYPINYYLSNGEPTFPPSLDRVAADSITVNYVLDRYIKTIGGADNLNEVKKLLQWWIVKVNNNTLYIKNKTMLPHYRLSTYSNKNMIVMKSVFNGEYGYIEKSGEINEISNKEFIKLSYEKSIFPIMHYQNDAYVMSVESKIPLQGEDTYKIRVEAPFGEVSFLYFRVSDGLLIRKDIINPKNENTIQKIEYSDFKTFNNIIYPYKINTLINGIETNMTLTQILINDKYIRKKNFK